MRLPKAADADELDHMVGHVHPAAVRAACFSPCGKLIALTHDDTVVTILDSGTEEVLHTLEKMHEKTIISLAFSPDGKLLAQGSKDNTATVVEVRSGEKQCKILCQVTGHQNQICDVCFSRDNKLLVVCSADGSMSVVKAREGTLVHKLDSGAGAAHTRWIRAADFSPDHRLLAVGCDDHTASVWNVETGERACVIENLHTKGIMAVRFDETGERLMLGSADKTVSVVDVSNVQKGGKWERLFRVDCEHTDGGDVWALNFSDDGRRVVLGSSDSVTSVVDICTGKKLLTLHGIHKDGITAACFSPDGRRILTGAGSAAKTASVHQLPVTRACLTDHNPTHLRRVTRGSRNTAHFVNPVALRETRTASNR